MLCLYSPTTLCVWSLLQGVGVDGRGVFYP